MTDVEIRALIAEVLGGIEPEAVVATVAGDAGLREAFDVDSLDFMNLVIGLHERTDVDIPEADHPELFTLGGATAYLKGKST
jgi:acyl carrier protein